MMSKTHSAHSAIKSTSDLQNLMNENGIRGYVDLYFFSTNIFYVPFWRIWQADSILRNRMFAEFDFEIRPLFFRDHFFWSGFKCYSRGV